MTSVDVTLGALLDPSRAARMEEFHAENAANPDFNELLGRLLDVVTQPGAISRATCRLTATRLMDLANNRDADPQVRAEATEALRGLATRLAVPAADVAEIAHRHALRDDIQRFLERPDQPRTQPRPPAVPPGPPIGD
ncbi:MAG: hypothetical protein DMF59_12500 [Acidobacteria bacterium]|nr:MAG: hypothetical protein DMF59_12500 [Acidobacteriota bacterium]